MTGESNRFYVGNLPYWVDWQYLSDLFGRAGKVEFVDVRKGPKGEPRGFAFVRMADGDAKGQAIQMFDGYRIGGRPLKVGEAWPLGHQAPDDFTGTNLWDDFIERAVEFVGTGQLDSTEIDYKLEAGEKIAAVRVEAQTGGYDWSKLNAALSVNFIRWSTRDDFYQWTVHHSDEATTALNAIWKGDATVTERIRAFSDALPKSVISGYGTRMNLIGGLLLGLDATQYPPFQVTTFQAAYEQTGFDYPEKDADEAVLYEHALGFLNQFLLEAEKRKLPVRHRLDAQSLVWAIVKRTQLPPMNNGGPQIRLPATPEEFMLHDSFVATINTLLKEKKQVIFQGPPGTGKTYVARALANHLAGAQERVTLVQFHPSYAYEDFVQGFRPALVNGQHRFELKDGPLVRAARRAQDEPDAGHFLVIDEINRGNLGRVLGELYFLLEYRDEEMRLQYSDEPFSLPENLYIIGTMNTADRSTALIDLALRRRFSFVEFNTREEPIKGLLRRWLRAKNLGHMEWVAGVVDRANEKLSDGNPEDRHAAIGPSYFMKEGLTEERARRIWKHDVLPYIEERLYGQHDRLGEFDLDTLRSGGASESAAEQSDADAGDEDDSAGDASD